MARGRTRRIVWYEVYGIIDSIEYLLGRFSDRETAVLIQNSALEDYDDVVVRERAWMVRG